MNVPLEYHEEGGRHNYPSKRRVKSQLPFNNIYLLQLGCHPVAVVILHVNKT